MMDPNRNSENRLEIYTLGNFMVRWGTTIISDETSNSYKLWKLFKFILTQKNKSLLQPEVIMETLWSEHNSNNPQHAMENLIYRLRRMLRAVTQNKEEYIIFKQGTYSFNRNAPYWFDAEAMEETCRQANSLTTADPGKAMAAYEQGLALYTGDFLPELPYEDWAAHARKYYHRVYIKNTLNYGQLLKEASRFDELEELMQAAIEYDPFEEELHRYLLEALVARGKIKRAKAHYNEISSLLQQELGIEPAEHLQELNKYFLRPRPMKPPLEFNGQMNKEKVNGAFFCDPDAFNLIYKLEERRASRNGYNFFTAAFTLTCKPRVSISLSRRRDMVEAFKRVLHQTLRQGDVVSQFEESLFCILLPNISQEKADQVTRRIKEKFNATKILKDITLDCEPQVEYNLKVASLHR